MNIDYYNIRAIPTKFNGRQYRSRLEAKWACMFTLMLWKFEYEPFDMNGWIPDFVIIGKKQDILVEVKPITSMSSEVASKMGESIKETDRSGSDLLLLGSTLPESDCWGTALGWLGENNGDLDPDTNSGASYGRIWWDLAIPGMWNEGNGIGLAHQFGSYVDRITGAYSGGTIGDEESDLVSSVILLFWDQASREVQYKGTGGAS